MAKTSLLHQPERLRSFERRLRQMSLEAGLSNLSLLVGDKFKVVRLIGHGASAVVCEALRPDWPKNMAVKLFPRTDDDREFSRVKVEAHSLIRLSHTNIVRVWDFDRAVIQPGDLPCYWLSMELIDGESLRTWLGKRRDDDAVLRVFCQIGEGLVAAHDDGLVHRDFKPENVMLTEHEVPKLVDFGLAMATGAIDERGAAGTPAFMPPEAFRGTSDARSDQFSFAATAWLAFCQEFPYDPENFDPSRGCSRPPRSGLDPRIVACLRRALDPDPARRFPTMRALLDELMTARTPLPAPAPPPRGVSPKGAPRLAPGEALTPTAPRPPEDAPLAREAEPSSPVAVAPRPASAAPQPRRTSVWSFALPVLVVLATAGSLAVLMWPKDLVDEDDLADEGAAAPPPAPHDSALIAAQPTKPADPFHALPEPPGCAIPAAIAGRWIFATAVESATEDNLKERTGHYSLDLSVASERCRVRALISKLGNDTETYKPALTDTVDLEFATTRPFTGRLTGTARPHVPWDSAAFTYSFDLIIDGDQLYGDFQARGKARFAGLLRGGRAPRAFPTVELTRERQPCLSLCALHCPRARCAADCVDPWTTPACATR